MTEWNEHMEEEFPKVERSNVSFNKKDSLMRYAFSDEEIQSCFQEEISAVRLSEERKKRLKKSENNRTVYFWISGMAAVWIAVLVLRTFIVIPDEPAPVEYAYQRPEKKIENKVDQRDTIYLISADWLLPWNNFDYSFYCGGTVFPNMWNPEFGYGFPNGTIPWSNLVYNPEVDSTALEAEIDVNQDSLLVAQIDSSIQQSKKIQSAEYLTVKDFINQKIDDRVAKFQKIKRIIRAARRKGNNEEEERLVIDWKGRRIGF